MLFLRKQNLKTSLLFFVLVFPSGDSGGDGCPFSSFSPPMKSARKCLVSVKVEASLIRDHRS